MSKSRQQDTSAGGQYCSITCVECGRKCGNYMEHYDKIRCSCGTFYWALRPKKNGPLVLYLYTSPNQVFLHIRSTK